MKMKDDSRNIYAQEDLDFEGPGAFLAGPTPRSTNVKSWRPHMIQILRNSGYQGKIVIPEMRDSKNWNPENGFTYDKQILWEDKAMTDADIIIFWIPRDMIDMPALTTNTEFGYWYAKQPEKLIIGIPDDAEKCDYIRFKAKEKCIFTNKITQIGKILRKEFKNLEDIK